MPSNSMVRSNSARLAYWFARRFLGSKLVDDSSVTLNRSLHQRNPREFGSGNQRNGLWFGVSHYGLDSKRLFHGTGSTYMAARDYYDILGVSRNASASEIESNFQEVQKAYEVLKDEEKRLMYDQEEFALN